MKLTYCLMVTSCITVTATQVLMSQDVAFQPHHRVATSAPVNVAASEPAAAPDAGMSWLGTAEEIESLIAGVDPASLDRDPFKPASMIAIGSMIGPDGARYDMPLHDSHGGMPAAAPDVSSAGRMASTPARSGSSRSAHRPAIEARSRISQRLNGTTSLFEETRFGALRRQQTAQRRPARRPARGGTVIRTTR